jgi:hypothetical protein
MKPVRVPVNAIVEKLRAYPASAFEHTEAIRSLLQEMPVDEASLAPYLTWDRQHYTRNLIDKSELRTACHLLGSRAVEFGAQPSRPNVLDGGAGRTPARRKFLRTISGYRGGQVPPGSI